MKEKDVKNRILEGAFKLFLIYNYEKVSVNEMEQVIGLSRGSIFYHTKSKEELFRAVIDRYILQKQDIIQKVEGPHGEIGGLLNFLNRYVDRVACIIESMRKFTHDDIDVVTSYWGLLYQAKNYYPEFSKLIYEKFQNDRLTIENVVIRAVETGEIKPELNPHIVAEHLRYIFIGNSFEESFNKGLCINTVRELLMAYYNLIKVV